jgi:hypothetical protein
MVQNGEKIPTIALPTFRAKYFTFIKGLNNYKMISDASLQYLHFML